MMVHISNNNLQPGIVRIFDQAGGSTKIFCSASVSTYTFTVDVPKRIDVAQLVVNGGG